MPKIIDLTGRRFASLTAIEKVGVRPDRSGGALWRFRCDCGAELVCLGTDVTRTTKARKSCGCVRPDYAWARTHGHLDKATGGRGSRTYAAWRAAKNRCRNANNPAFRNYGARGITFSPRWDRFEDFLADMGECPPDLSLDRIDNERGYEPGNCRWAEWRDQVRNTRHNVFVDVDGERLALIDFARLRGIGYGAIQARIRRGEDPHRAADILAAKRGHARAPTLPEPM